MANKTTYICRAAEPALKQASNQYPVITILGARQTGKSTLVKHAFPEKPYINLEDFENREFARLDPKGFLSKYENGAILDEIQNVPELLSYVQVITDASNQNGLFILTGSHQLSLHQGISQSLAGRTAIFELMPLSIAELANSRVDLSVDEYLYKGFYPRIYKEELNPTQAYRDYVKTFVERDVRQIINVKDLTQFQRFLRLCASRVGQIANLNNICNEIGISNHTAKSWLSVLQASYVLILLQPYYENFGKRIIKSPKLYFADVGLATYLLDITNVDQIARDPLRGQLVENLVITELFKHNMNHNLSVNYYFYRDQNAHEVDVIFKEGSSLVPIEIKASQTFHKQFLKGLKYFSQLAGQRVQKGFLIYTGTREQEAGGFNILNYKNISKIYKK